MPNTPNIVTRDTYTNQQTIPPNNTAQGWGYWASMTEAPSAAAYGVGAAWIGGSLYYSDGDTWSAQRVPPKRTRVALVGDSLTALNLSYGYPGGSFTPSLPSAVNVLGFDQGPTEGTATLSYSAGNKTLSFSAPGESYGTPVDVSKSGVYYVPAVSPLSGVWAVVRASSMPVSDASYSTTITKSTFQRAWRSEGYFSWVQSLSKWGFDVVAFLGNSGSVMSEIAESAVNQLQSVDFDICILMGGTNDLAGTPSLPTMKASAAAVFDLCERKGARCYALPTPPRGTMTAAVAGARDQYNRWLFAECGRRLSTIFVPTDDLLVDRTSATDNAITDRFSDGVHFSKIGAYLVGKRLAQELSDFKRKDAYPSICYSGYDATNNPTGNLLVSGRGVWAGTGGTASTGVTSTSGIPSGWTASRQGSTATATCDKVARNDGTNGVNMRFVIASGTTGDYFKLANTSSIGSGYTGGDELFAYCDYTVVSQTLLQRLDMWVWCNDGSSNTRYWESMFPQTSTLQHVPSGEAFSGRLCVPQIIVPPGATAFYIQITCGTLTGGACTVDFGDIFFGKKQ